MNSGLLIISENISNNFFVLRLFDGELFMHHISVVQIQHLIEGLTQFIIIKVADKEFKKKTAEL